MILENEKGASREEKNAEETSNRKIGGNCLRILTILPSNKKDAERKDLSLRSRNIQAGVY
jgi:hypothetical protein